MGAARTNPRLPGPELVAAGGCFAWPLPLEAICASQARHSFREVASAFGLGDELVYDGMTMASELAANTLHAHDNVEFDTVGEWAVAGGPELWMYLRRWAGGWELVCKVYDSLSGWKGGRVPAASGAAPDACGGRGLQVVASLSGGRWGHHLTRSRLGGWKVPGKAVWFAQPVPGECVPDDVGRFRMGPAKAARRLEAMLAARDLGRSLLRIDEPGAAMSVLSVRCGLTVWCCGPTLWWRTPEGRYERRLLTDLEDVAEQVVCACEEMDRGADAARLTVR